MPIRRLFGLLLSLLPLLSTPVLAQTGFLDAYGNPADSYATGSTAYVRVDDPGADQPGVYDTVQVTLRSLSTGDLETLTILETARDGGRFEGSIPLETEDVPPAPVSGDGKLQAQPGEEIEAAYGASSDQALIRYGAAMFIDETGVVTGEVLEKGAARIRVIDTSPYLSGTTNVMVRSLYGADQEIVSLTETSSGSHVYEGTVELAFVPPGGGIFDNGRLDASNSGSPDYLGDELTLLYLDAEGHGVTIPSRLQFIDAYGRVTSTFAVGERIGVRLEDHNADDPQTRGTVNVLVTVPATGEIEPSVALLETGFDTNVYEGSIASDSGPPAAGTLQVDPGDVIQAEHGNATTPDATVAQAAVAAAAVLFLDADGEPAEVYLESTRAYVRVVDAFATGSVAVTVQSVLGFDSETLTLSQTGPGVFEGSIGLSIGPPFPGNGSLETEQDPGNPHEYDTLRATYGSAVDTVGTISSRTWFVDAYGNSAVSYATGSRAYVRVEDHNADQPGVYNTVQVTLRSLATGDLETLTILETARDGGIFAGSIALETENYPPSPVSGDGTLQAQPGEEIEAVHSDWTSATNSSDRARILYAAVTFIDEAGAATGEVPERGVARIRVIDTSPFRSGSTDVMVRSLYGADQEIVDLTETSSGSHVYEGTVELGFVPPGGGTVDNGRLDASTSGSPAYLGDALTLLYLDALGHGVTVPSRLWFIDGFGRVASTFAVGDPVGVRLEDHNQDDPAIRRTINVLVTVPETGETEQLTLLETDFDSNVYEGSIVSNAGPSAAGTLQVQPGDLIQAEHGNMNTPFATVAQATMTGASVLFMDADGQPAEVYFESTRAYVRVADALATGSVTVTVQSVLGQDSEILTLSQTGPGVFEGSIRLSIGPVGPGSGSLETEQDLGSPHEYDTLRATYGTVSGPIMDTVGTISSRTWFVDADGNLADSYATGSRAYVRVEDHNADLSVIFYNTVQVTLRSLATGDLETLTIWETARDGGIFAGSIALETENYPPSPVSGDGTLQAQPGEEIEVVHTDWTSVTNSSDRARILYAAVTFIDETGAATVEVLERGVARIRVIDTSPFRSGSTDVMVRSLYGADQEIVDLTETSSGSHVYEGTVQLGFVPPGGGTADNGRLDASTSGSPSYLGDELTLLYLDALGHGVTIPSRLHFIDGFGRETSTFAVGDPVGVRLEDHNQDDPAIRRTINVLVTVPETSETEQVTLQETDFDSNVYESAIVSNAGPSAAGTLQVQPGDLIQAEHGNMNTPFATVAQAVMSGASVLFVDADGQPAEVYFESTRAYVRVADAFATGSVTATVQSVLGFDSETLTLSQTGPGVFEGSIGLSIGPMSPGNGSLETRQDLGNPHEFDTLRAIYGSAADTVGTIGSRTWFVDAYGNLADSYATGSRAYVRVEDHNADQPGIYNTVQVTLRSLATGDLETLTIWETARDGGIFAGSIALETENYPPSPVSGDGTLQAQPGEEIEVVHTDWTSATNSSDRARILYATVTFIDETGAATVEVLERGVARIRVIDTSPFRSGSTDVMVRSLYGADQEIVDLTETSSGSHVYEGTVELGFVPPGGGTVDNGRLDASSSGSPSYLGDELTLLYLDALGHGVTIPSRLWFIDGFGRVTSTFAVGDPVGVRLEDHNQDDPYYRRYFTVLVTVPETGETEQVTLQETDFDSNVYEGSIVSNTGPSAPGTLQVQPGDLIQAEHGNMNTPFATVAQATMTGASVLFVDANGQPAEIYLESSRAYLRVADSTATGSVVATVQSVLGQDSETVTLNQTGAGLFEGSIGLSIGPVSPGNGSLETEQDLGNPHEFDTLRATYGSVSGPIIDTIGTISSRTWFVDAYGNLADSYATGSRAYVRVEDHNADQPGVSNTVQVTLRSLATGDLETLTIQETALDGGIFAGSIALETEDYPPSPVSGDGTLQAQPGEEIEVVHTDWTNATNSSDRARIRYAAAMFIDEAGVATGEVLERGVARIRVIDTSPFRSGSTDIMVRSLYGADQEIVVLAETSSGSHVYEGMVQLEFVPPGGGTADNGLLDTSTTGQPAYLQDELTLFYLDALGHGVTVPSRITFLDLQGQATTQYALRSPVRVRLEDHNANVPNQVDTATVFLTTPGDSEAVTVTETGPNAGIFEASLPSSDSPGVTQDGTLAATAGTVALAEHFNAHTPNETTAEAVFTGNFAPQAVDDTAETVEQPVTIAVLANDTDPDSEPLAVASVTQGANGAVAINGDGTVTYTPAPEFLGTDTFTYVAADPRGGQARATVTVTVLEENAPPTPADDAATTEEDVGVNIQVLANDTDPDGDPLRVRAVGTPANGTAFIEADNSITFWPDPNWSGQTSFTYMVEEDPDGLTAYATVTVTVTPVNDPPVAVDDTATTDEDTAVTIPVLANDTDPDNDMLDVYLVTAPTNGIPVLNADETVTFTPAAGFHGTASFYYEMRDPAGSTDVGQVTITVSSVNDLPVAVDDTAVTDEDSSVSVTVLANDTDADNDTLDVTAVTQGANGAVAINPDDTVTYTPAANWNGTDSFTYTVSDGNGGTDTATVTVTVTGTNDAPVANDDAATVAEDSSVTVNVLGNDSDLDNDTLTVSAVTQGTNGSVTLNPVTYTPAANFHGTDSFTYTVSDGNGGTDTATVTVTVSSVNDAPVANDDTASVVEDGSMTVNVLGNDSDADNDTLAVTAVTQGANGAVTLDPVTYTPAPNFFGTDSFTYTVSDGNGGTDSATVTVTVTPVNDAPVAGDDTAAVVEDGSVAVNVLGNDADVDEDLLSVTSVTQGTHGSVVINPDDTVTYTPVANYNGADSFTYTVSDGTGGEDTATVTVTVGAANDAPVANDDSASTAEDNAVTVSVLANDSDLENDTLTVSAVTQGANGAVVVNANNTVTYTPGADFHGSDSFTYTASDGNGGTDTATVTITINPVNDAPVANDDPASVAEDSSVTVTVRANDSDVDNDTLDVTAVTQGASGSVVLNADDTVTYTPAANFNGTDSFTYTVIDGNGGTDTATVTITVGAANDAPVANDDTAAVAEDGSVTVSVLGNDTDLDNDTLSVTAVTQGANGSVTVNPVTYTPNANFFGTDSFTYTISDGNGGTDTATVTVTVTAVNDAPVAVNDSAATLAETPVTIQVRNNDTDVDSATLTVTAVTQGAHGSVAIDAGQTVTYTPATAWIGPDSFTYTISDGAGGTATATVNVDVQAPPRVSGNLQVLYAFNEGSGTTVNDTSGVGTPLNLTVANAAAVTWLPGALSIDSSTLVQSAGAATKVINACKSSNEVTVEAWVVPANLSQTGPAAIVTISQNQTKRDVTLGQSGTAYNGQLRTSTTGQGGTQLNASGVATLNLSHVVYTRSSTGAVRIYVNGTQVATGTLTGNLSSWASFNLALGGELSGTRYWTGDLHLVAIYSRALTSTEVRQNFLAGAN